MLGSLPEEELKKAVASLSEREAASLLYDWTLWARPEQLAPPGDWNIWLILTGRGWGKTRTGAEDVKKFGLENPGVRIAVCAPTYADARDTCVEGESGLLSVLPPEAVKVWNRSLGELVLTNGTRYKLFSADEPERFRGPQHHRAWADELASWSYTDSWDQLQFGLRLGRHPQTVVTTTPKPVALVRNLLAREGEDVVVTRGSTFENAHNLSPVALSQLKRRYEGTRLGRQELYAEVLSEIPGALWTRATLEQCRVESAPELARVVVAVDPAVTSDATSDETGIVVCGRGVDGHYYVLADRSCRLSPDGWARRVVAAYEEYEADRIIAEVNNGGDLVERVLRTVSPRIPYRAVRASRGKIVRAEPVAALYEQKRVFHVGDAAAYAALEDQMVSFLPGGPVAAHDDRVDALVYAVADLSATARALGRVVRKPQGL